MISLFDIGGKHILEFLGMLKLGKKPHHIIGPKNPSRHEKERSSKPFIGHTSRDLSKNAKILSSNHSQNQRESHHQRYNSHSLKQSIALESDSKTRQMEML
jgi:hypothetical protein